MASCEEHDRCLRFLDPEHDHPLGYTRAGWNVDDSLGLRP
jgi:hypothetical protein